MKFARDIFRLTGSCAPRDLVGAIRDIETALQSDLHESAILVYADALLLIGQSGRAGPWIRPAIAIAVTSHGAVAGPFGNAEVQSPWLRGAIGRTALALDSGNALRIVDVLAAYFARPPRAPFAEERLARLALSKLERADPRESLYWQGRFQEWNAEFSPVGVHSSPDYSRAISCGDRRAMRRLAGLYVAGKAHDAAGHSVYGGLSLIADPTAEERDLIAALERRFGHLPPDMSDPMVRESRAMMDRSMCESILRSVAGRPR